jgi:putative transferase (TIGR04331 family)
MEDENLLINPAIDVFSNNVAPNAKSKRYGIIRYYLKMIKSLRGKSRIKFQINRYDNIAIGFQDDDGINIEVDTLLKPFYPFFLPKNTDKLKREICLDGTDGFSAVFIKNLIKLIPKFYIEYFKYFYEKIPLFKPESKIFHVTALENVFISLLIAKYAENGAQIHYYQHGGFYGEYEFHSAHHHESNISDKFFTWGWQMLQKDIPNKAFRCEKFKNNYKIKASFECDILLVFPVIESKMIQKTKINFEFFFRSIDHKKYPVVYARPRPTSMFNRKASLYFIRKDVKKIDAGYQKISKLISKSKLVVQVTYPSTNMLECLYVDHPAVALLENFQPSKIVKPYYDFFLENGVFHSTIESMVKHLNSVAIDKWWAEIIQHPTYISFKNEFIRKV